MEIRRLDIWNQWHRDMAVIIQDGTPIINESIYIYAFGKDGFSDGVKAKILNNHGGSPEKGNYKIQNDALINLLYFAADRAKVGIKLCGLGAEDVEIKANELKSIEMVIDQLVTIYSYKTKKITLERFAGEFKDQIVFYSTLIGEKDHVGKTHFSCSSSHDNVTYYPAFLTAEHMAEFFKKNHRLGYIVMQDKLKNLLSFLDTNHEMAELGVVIEPLYDCNVSIPPLFRIN